MPEEEPIPVPHEHKTYEKEPLYTVVYAQAKDGTAISYQRIYKTGWLRIQEILQVIRQFYSYKGEGYEGKRKLCLTELSKKAGMDITTARVLLIQMASCKKIIKRKGKNWVTESDKPLVILQQKAKHVEKRFWGKRCPLYVLPFEGRYYKRKE